MKSSIPVTEAEKHHPRIWLLLKIILPIIVILAGYGVMKYMIATAPKAGRQAPPRTARLVDVQTVAPTNAHAIIAAMGVVHPARQVTLHPRISGTVTEISSELIPGGIKSEGDVLLEIDRLDYDLALRRAQSVLATAESEYALELGQQALARKEFELLGGDDLSPEEKALILREPQKARAEANRESARAAVDGAKLDLERTTITAPFNAIVRERHVDVGMQVSPSSPLATLTDVDTYWVIAPVPVSQLPWLRIPERAGETGALVSVMFEGAPARQGRVLRLLNELETDGRLAQLLIEVEDPLALKPESDGLPKLLISDFVRVEIDGRWMEDVIALDRRLVRNYDQTWVMNEQDELEIRTLDVVFRGEREVFVRGGLVAGDRVVTTDLASPVNGMKLTTGRRDAGSAP
jgi:RND family efflux transporter MFP subunit